MDTCPKCGAELVEECTVCEACGCDLSQATASFEPVGVGTPDGDGTAVTSEVPLLVVNKGPQLGERFFLDRDSLTVGRDPHSDIFLNDMTVSREHARLDVIAGTASVTDLGSLNGTYVNGVWVDSAQLQSGDVVQVGTFQMTYFGAEQESGS